MRQENNERDAVRRAAAIIETHPMPQEPIYQSLQDQILQLRHEAHAKSNDQNAINLQINLDMAVIMERLVDVEARLDALTNKAKK